MALTDRRWFGLTIVACALIWVGLMFHPLQPRETLAAQRSTPTSERDIVAAQLSQANGRLRLLELRDSVASLDAKRTNTNVGIYIDESLPENLRGSLTRVLTSQWQALVPEPKMRVAIAVVIDSGRSPHGHPRPYYSVGAIPIETFMPSTATDGTCIALAHLAATPRGQNGKIVMQNLLSGETIAALLNPCALLAGFGDPGPHISEWLRDERWTVARLADWSAAPSPWSELIQPTQRGPNIPGGWLAGLGDPSWHIRAYVAPEGIACLAGERGSCARIVLNHRRLTTDSAWRTTVVSSSGTSTSSFFFPASVSDLGPADGWLVSEMVRTLGRDRFARFWRSSLPVDAAFRDASGQDLDDWVRGWSQHMYGSAEVGPTISLTGLLTGAVVLLVGLTASIAVERKRRVA